MKTYRIRVIGLDMEESIILTFQAETAVQAMSLARTDVEKCALPWDTLEMIH